MHCVVGLEVKQKRKTENSRKLDSIGTIRVQRHLQLWEERSTVWFSRIKEGKASASEKHVLLIKTVALDQH